MKNKLQLVDECKARLHCKSNLSSFKTLFLLLLLFVNVFVFGQSTCSTAVNNVPDTTRQLTLLNSTSNEYWMTFIGDSFNRYTAIAMITDSLYPNAKIQDIKLYVGNCNDLTLLGEDSICIINWNIIQGQRYF